MAANSNHQLVDYMTRKRLVQDRWCFMNSMASDIVLMKLHFFNFFQRRYKITGFIMPQKRLPFTNNALPALFSEENSPTIHPDHNVLPNSDIVWDAIFFQNYCVHAAIAPIKKHMDNIFLLFLQFKWKRLMQKWQPSSTHLNMMNITGIPLVNWKLYA